MTRRVITAREQHEMLSPWQLALPQGWEDYVSNLSGRPDRSGDAHLHLPVEVLNHYKEHDRNLDSSFGDHSDPEDGYDIFGERS